MSDSDRRQDPIVIKNNLEKQKHSHSILESLVHLMSGFIVAFVVVLLLVPEVGVFDNLAVVTVITIIKFVVNYYIRRFFTSWR